MTSTGEGPGGSQAFDLTAGDYLLRWSANAPSTSSCHHRAALETTDEDIVKPLMDEDVTAAIVDRVVALTGQPAGTYYIDVNSECAWSFSITASE